MGFHHFSGANVHFNQMWLEKIMFDYFCAHVSSGNYKCSPMSFSLREASLFLKRESGTQILNQ
jgi:hypothetical protein